VVRLHVNRQSPEGYRAVVELDRYIHDNLDPTLVDVIKLRVSQLNGCAFCVDLHATDLEKRGVAVRKIFAVSAWRETDFFSEQERAALALAEAMTRISDGVSDEVWDKAAAVFAERDLSDLILAIGTINLWNRIGVTTHLSPPPLSSRPE